MVSFAQRFQSSKREQFAVNSTDQLGPASEKEMSTLLAAVKAFQLEQQSLKMKLRNDQNTDRSYPVLVYLLAISADKEDIWQGTVMI